MGSSSLIFSFDRFSGINNVEEQFRMLSTRDSSYRKLYDVNEIENMDIDNSMVLSTRPGSNLELSGSDIHSLWSDGKLNCLFVDGTILYKLNPQYTSTLLGVVGGSRMSYALCNDRTYMTNGTFIGYSHNNVLFPLTDPGTNYKLPLPAGKFIAHYRARLYVAKGKVLYIADPLKDCYDVRTGFKTFSGNITMLAVSEKGLYVSDGVTWFCIGSAPEEFLRTQVLDSDAIPYTAISINGNLLGDGLNGKHVIWASANGICLGDGDGTVKNLTRHRYSMSPYTIGGAVVRIINEVVHYIVTLE